MPASDLAFPQDEDQGRLSMPLKSGNSQDSSQMDVATNSTPSMDATSTLHPSTLYLPTLHPSDDDDSSYNPARALSELVLDSTLIPLEKIPVSYATKLQSKSTTSILANKNDALLPLTSIHEGVTLAWKVTTHLTIKQETIATAIAHAYQPFYINSLTPGLIFSTFRREDEEQINYALSHAIKINNDYFVPSKTRYGVSGQQIITALHVPPYVTKNPINKSAFTEFLRRTFNNYGN
ncbi:hypothetical protein BGZ92_006646, partial [Podila epicladia]